MKDIAIFGAGGFGKEVASLIDIINKKKNIWNFVGFFDDAVGKGTQISHYGRVLGGMKEVNEWGDELDLAIAIGSPVSLRKVQERITNKKILFPNIVHPDFKIVDTETFSLGIGNIIQTDCVVSCDVNIGNFNILNGSVVIGHDASIGNYNVIMPDIRISGEVVIGDENLLGVGAIVLQQIKIGNKVHIGAGAVLMTKPKNGCVYLGNPAKRFNY